MIFCGQCGFQLAPGTARCPRCGTTVEETSAPSTGLHTNDATISSPPVNVRNSAGVSQASPPQPLILRPGADGSDYGSQVAYDATSRMDAPNFGTQVAPRTFSGQGQGGYADFGTRGAGTYGGGGYLAGTQQGYQQAYTPETNKVRVTALVLVLLGVLLLIIAVILFFLQRGGVIA